MEELFGTVLARPDQGIPVIKQMAEFLGYPTHGEFACCLWQLCSGHRHLPVSLGKSVYEELGYVPFSGYPLLRR